MSNYKTNTIIAAVICAAGILGSAQAADLPGKGKVMKAPEVGGLNFCRKPTVAAAPSTIPGVPGGDVFGFSTSADVGSPGDCGIAFESTTRFGKTGGSYESFGLKTQLSATILPNTLAAVSFFTTQHHIDNTVAYADRNHTGFDGLSGELYYRVVERSKTNPISVTFGTEPRWNRIDSLGGGQVTGYGNEFKMFVDAVVIPDKLFAVWNVNYGVGETKVSGAGSKYAKASYINTSAGLTYQWSDKFYTGIEARYVTSYTGSFLNRKVGDAVFVGPNFLYRVTDAINFNVAWTPQVSGKQKGVSGSNLDLVDFERNQVRVKLTYAF